MARVIGVVLIIGAAVLYKFFIHDLLADAREGRPSVTIYEKTVILVGVLPVVGLTLVALGDGAVRLMKFRGRPSLVQIALLVIVVAAGLGVRIWVGTELSALGYDDLGNP